MANSSGNTIQLAAMAGIAGAGGAAFELNPYYSCLACRACVVGYAAFLIC